MKMSSTFACMAMAVVVVLGVLVGQGFAHGNGMHYDYYRYTCPEAEGIISDMVAKINKTVVAAPARLVRMHFHDCFVRGCDGSVLLNSTEHNLAEKDSPVNNPSLKGFDIVDQIKEAVEAKCPGVVSCADILAYAARDAVYVAGFGAFPRYEVKGGRKDGMISLASEPALNLAPPTANLSSLIRFFEAKGLSYQDMVILSGGHTIGVSSCKAIGNRQDNFQKTGKPDPTLDAGLAAFIRQQCPKDNNTAFVFMDRTPLTLDVSYYVGVNQHKGVFTSDAALLSSEPTRQLIESFIQSPQLWAEEFVRAMKKMGQIQIKTGHRGEIRRKCYQVNSY